MSANIAGRASGAMIDRVDPAHLLIVTDPDHPLFQPARSTDDPPDWFVASIREHGVQAPIKVRRGPTKRGQVVLEVVDGRQRVLAARIVNRERVEAGKMPILVPCDTLRSDETDAARLVAALNGRVPVDPLTAARTAAAARKFGANDRQICTDNGWTQAALERHFALLECVPEVQEAVRAGALALRAVPALRKLDRGAQVEAAHKAAATGRGGAREVVNEAAAAHPETRAPRMRSRKQIEARINEFTAAPPAKGAAQASAHTATLAALRWVLGEETER